jgi:hypothetical protein
MPRREGRWKRGKIQWPALQGRCWTPSKSFFDNASAAPKGLAEQASNCRGEQKNEAGYQAAGVEPFQRPQAPDVEDDAGGESYSQEGAP